PSSSWQGTIWAANASLISTMSMFVADLDLRVEFAAGEELRTEISAKFTPERIRGDLEAAGLELETWLTDPEDLFAISVSGLAR
ncbi:MAG: L-histidine N(alpha)-methyltransferase, partial [Solirubrobacteraceae bacterium]